MSPLQVVQYFVFIVMVCMGQVENRSLFGIGMRIIGDQLLVKDVQASRPAGLTKAPTILFNYRIPEPITYIEIATEENVLAEVNFGYQHDLVKGNVTAINASATPFEALITIYGFNETMLNVNPSLILNRDQQFEGKLEPIDDDYEDGDEDDDELDEAGLAEDEEYLDLGPAESLANFPAEEDHSEAEDADELSVPLDKIIEVGHRQPGDHLIYEAYQTSATSGAEPANHSVIFYYVDSNFITYGQFVLYEYYANKLSTDSSSTAAAEYSHYSPTTLKAVITDDQTTFLFVQMRLYGYKPADLPRTYVPYLGAIHGKVHAGESHGPVATDAPHQLSPLQRLKALMQAQQEEVMQTQAAIEATSTAAPEPATPVVCVNVASISTGHVKSIIFFNLFIYLFVNLCAALRK